EQKGQTIHESRPDGAPAPTLPADPRPATTRLTGDSIEAHLTIVFAALAVTRHLIDKSGYSMKRVVRTLRPVRDAVISLRGQRIAAPTPLEGEAADIVEETPPVRVH